MPGEALASGFGFDIVRTIVNGQLQGVHALATRIVGISIRVCT